MLDIHFSIIDTSVLDGTIDSRVWPTIGRSRNLSYNRPSMICNRKGSGVE
jgi:hypothetical protein